jgi:hypothetical protein
MIIKLENIDCPTVCKIIQKILTKEQKTSKGLKDKALSIIIVDIIEPIKEEQIYKIEHKNE